MCRLPTDRCRIVLSEMKQLELQKMHDYQMLTGLRPYQRDIAVSERNYVRLSARLKALPRDVSNELGRLLLCDSKDRLAGARGTLNDAPDCQ